ncbi:MAG: hypothetical protein HOW73_03410 [Polyangiaceae bacterium]|nr:hypothetical protein [Polyangiaceae bacterium]
MTTRPDTHRSSASSPSARAGFTAVELMVAITTSLIVCAGAYTLAKTSLEVFQQEARMNSAQFNNVMGMNRLSTDIKRAGFQTSPDADTDLQVCAPPTGALAGLLKAVNVFEGADSGTYGSGDYLGLPSMVTGPENNRAPDRIRLAANYTTSDKYRLGPVDMTGNKISVQVDQLAVQRIFHDARLAGGNEFCSAFPAGGIARLVDAANRTRFIEVASCATTDNTDATNYASITITAVNIPVGTGCGEATQGYINPVNVIDYVPVHLTNLNATSQGLGTTIQTLLTQESTNAGVTGDESRMMLVRRALGANGAILPNSTTIEADYLVDLNFSARYASDALQPNTHQFADFEAVGAIPENQVRSLGIRMTTRSRFADRAERGFTVVPNASQPLPRFEAFTSTATNRMRFARVRTFFTEVAISNLQGVVPW